MLLQNVRMALASIQRNKLRSALTMLGMVIGIGSVITVITIGEGLKSQVNQEVEALGSDNITVSAKPDGGPLTLEDLEELKKISSIHNVTPVTNISVVATQGDLTMDTAVVSATQSTLSNTFGQDISQGKFFDNGASGEAVIGSEVASTLFGEEVPLNKTITLSQQVASAEDELGEQLELTFKVVGVYGTVAEKSSIGPGAQLDNSIYIPFEDGRTFSGGSLFIDQIVAQARDSNNLSSAKTTIVETLKTAHDGQEDFFIETAEDISASFNDILSVITNFITAIAGISLLVGGIGIMNIMLTSVTERTREIGIRKSIGASNAVILAQFLIEALVLTVFGGLLGIALSLVGGIFIESLIDIKPIFTLSAFAIGLGVSILIGLIFGTTPALKAARKKPIDALHYE